MCLNKFIEDEKLKEELKGSGGIQEEGKIIVCVKLKEPWRGGS